jgi:hypothetical protein
MVMETESREQLFNELSEEIISAGFPLTILPNLRREMERIPAGHVKLPFDKGLGRPGLSGNIYLEPEPLSRLYRFTHFDLDLGPNSDGPIRQHAFDRIPGDDTTLQEAVNLMEGRFVYREPLSDHHLKAYWVSLSPRDHPGGHYQVDRMATTFRPEDVIRDSPASRYMSGEAQQRLAGLLRQGDRVKLEMRTPNLTQAVYVEICMLPERLRVTNGQGKELDLEEMARSLEAEYHRLGHGRGRR